MFVIIRSDISYELSAVARRDKTLPRTKKHFPRIKKQPRESENTSQSPKKTSQNPKHLVLGSILDHGICFWILARIFGFSESFFMVGPKTTPQTSIKAKFTYLLHFFSFLGQTCQIDYDC